MKKTIKDNCRLRVEISPFLNSRYSFDDWERAYKDTIQQIKRHVDDIVYAALEFDVHEVCEFCGHDWEVIDYESAIVDWVDTYPDAAMGTPLCCTKAYEEWKELQTHKEQS